MTKKSVTRYRVGDSYGDPCMYEDDSGDYVRYDDIKHLLSVEPSGDDNALDCPTCGQGHEGPAAMELRRKLAEKS